MLSECEHCGEFAVDDSENQDVCHACGIVAQEIKLTKSEYISKSSYSYKPYSSFEARIQRKKKTPVSVQHGLNVLDNLCHEFNVNATLKAEIIDMLKYFCTIRNFRHKEDAGVTAACCLFLVQRKNKQAIPIKNICRQAQCNKGKFSHFLRFVKSHLKDYHDTFADVSHSEHVEKEDISVVNNTSDIATSILREVCDKADKEEKNKLMEKATALVKLADACWLLSGRSPRSVVVACSYLCWKSMSPFRKKASFNKFCSAFEIHEPIALLRIRELQTFLLKLGQKIPSYSKNYVNEDNLLFHLDTILENSETLRNDLLPDTHAREAVNCKEFATFRFPPKNPPRKEPTSPVIYDSDMNASDIEISDTEIESYIRSDTKMKIIEFCKQKKLIE